MNHKTDKNGYAIVPVEPTHQIRVNGPNTRFTYALAYERVRIGRPHRYDPDEVFVSKVAGKVGRQLYIVQDGDGHRIERLGNGMIPVLRGHEVGAEGIPLQVGDVIQLGPVEITYELLPTIS